MNTNMKILHNIYDEGATIISSSGTEWKRFLTFAKDVHKYNFDSNIFIYIQRPKVTALATADIWKKLGRNVLEDSKSVVIPNFSTKKQEYFFDISQTVGKSIDLSMWKFEQEDYRLLEEFLTAEKNDYKNHQELLKGIEKAIADKAYEQLKPDVDNRKSLLAYFSVLYLVHEKLELPMFNVAKSDYYLNSIVKEVSTLEELRTLGNYVFNNAKSILSEIERWKKQVNQEKEEQKHEYRNGQIKGEHPLHERGRRISVSEHSNGHRGESREVWRSSEDLHGGESSRPIHLFDSEREDNSNTNENGGRSVQSYGEVRREVGEGISKARDRQYSGSNSTSQPIEKYSGRNRNEGNSPSSTLKETALVENGTSAVFHSNKEQEEKIKQGSLQSDRKTLSDFLLSSSIPLHFVDEFLRTGSNKKNSTLRICSFYKKNHTLEENVTFLKEEYGTGGKGLRFGNEKFSVWFSENGVQIAKGETVLKSSKSILITWEQVFERITELLHNGQYLPKTELDKADTNEINEIASKLWYLYSDSSMGIPKEWKERGYGFPSNVEEISQRLSHQDTLAEIVQKLERDIQEGIFTRKWSRPKRILRLVKDLQREPLAFISDKDILFNHEKFITQDEVNAALKRGSSFAQGKFRIYSYFLHEHTTKEKVDFLKQEYGTGGSSGGVPGTDDGYESHDPKGIELSRGGFGNRYDIVKLSWNDVAKRIDELIADGQYMNKEELVYLPEYEKSVLSKQIHLFFYNQSNEVINSYRAIADYDDTQNMIRSLLDDADKLTNVIREMQTVYESLREDDRRYHQMNKAYNDVLTFQSGAFTLFPTTPVLEKQVKKLLNRSGYMADKLIGPAIEELKEEGILYPIPSQIFEKVKEVLRNREGLNVQIDSDQRTGAQSVGDSLQLSFFPSEDKEYTVETTEEVLPPFSERLLPGVLRYDAMMSVKKTVIEAYFKEHSSPTERAEFLSKAYNKDYSIFSVDTPKRRVGYHVEEKGLYVWEGEFLTRTSGSLYSWDQLQDYVAILMESGVYLKEPLLEEEFMARDSTSVLLDQQGSTKGLSNYYREQENPYPKGAKSKYQGNVAAIKLLKKLENESRLPGKEEQQILAKYVGWGGLANAFSSDYDEWKNEYQELKKLLAEEEYESARTSTLTAYYTEPFIIKQIYATLERFSFKGGTILDPAMGTGNFFSMLPKGLRNSSLTGVELDSISGRISKMLYPEANIRVQGYEHSDIADNSMDVVVGNIPFNNFSISDKRYKKDYLIHDYFFKRSLDIVKPNGVVAFITSSGTLDKKEITSRLELFEQADLIGAVRLPVNVFGEIAGTSVTTDILFFQKREKTINQLRGDGEVITSPNWVYTDVSPNESKSPLSRYFIENPSMILGDFQTKSFRGITVEVVDKNYDKATFEQKLEQALSTIQLKQSLEQLEVQSVTSETKSIALDVSIPSEKNEELPDISSVRPYTYIINNDDIYYVDSDSFVKQQVGKTIANRIKGMVQVKEALLEVMNIQVGAYIESDLAMALEKLNHVYDQFVEKYDVINSKANMQAFRQDDQLPLLRAIEVINKHSGKYEKAKVFFEATIKPIQKIENVDSAQEALIYSLNEVGEVDFSTMQKVYNLEEGKMIEELKGHIFFEPVTEYLLNGEIRGNWVTREAYLSGDVKTKLDVAKKLSNLDGKYTHNVEELEKVIPEDLKPSEIGFKLGSIWIPIQYVEQFMYETMETANYNRFGRSAIKVHYSDLTTKWNIEGKTLEYNSVKANKTYGTNRMNGYEILEDSLNLQSCTIYDKEYYYENGDRKHRYVLNPKETMLARSKQQLLQEAFSSWLFQDRDRAKELVSLYNERFNRIVSRKYNGDYLTFPNMNKEMKLRPHQKNVVSRIVNNRTALMAHEVGAGKTAAMIASGMYLKRLGTAQKPMYVVPNHLVEQFGMEFLRFFPKANVLMTTKKDFEKQNRKTFVSKIATGNYDAIIIGQSQFERIPLSVERQRAMMKEEINQVKLAIQEVKANDGERWTIKQMELFTKNLESKLEKLNNEDKKDNLLTFEQLGVDFLFVDEAHHYKNCFVYSKMTNVAGISQSNSQRATDMLMKCQYMQEINERGGVVFATGTPISNSMSEMYVMQRYLQPQTLRDMGLSSFDAWASTFGEVVSSLEITPEGSGYKMKSRFAKFHNLPELMNIFYEIADIQTSDMLNLPVPKLVGDKAEIIATEATEYQEMVMESFIERSEIIRAGGVEPSQDNMLKLTHEAKLLAIDPRLFDETAPNDPYSKLNVCINNVHRIWEETKENRSTQMVFCDSGTPKKDRFNVYDEVKRSLVEKGILSEEIAFIHDAKTEVQRDKLFKKIREGDVRILLGSTSKVGMGTNVQDKLIAGHHIDCPWRPSDIIRAPVKAVV